MKFLYFPFYLFVHHYFFIFILFLKNCYDSLATIETGVYPYIKRLNDGSYIMISSSGISFIDETFTNQTIAQSLRDNNNQDLVYSNRQNIASTFAVQYSHQKNGYIVAIVEQLIYIFSPNGALSAGGSSFSTYIKNPAYACSVILDNNVNSDYYFTIIITLDSGGSYCENCLTLKFNKMKFVPSGSITFVSESTFSFTEDFKSSFGCDIMIDDQEYIACFYGNSYGIYCSVFNWNYVEVKNKSYTFDSNFGGSGMFLNVKVEPATKQKALICGYNGHYFCISYDITTNLFGTISQPIGK